MHLVIVTNRFIVGEEQGRVNVELARAAARRDHTVTCLAHAVDNRLLMEPNVEWTHMPDANSPSPLIGNLRFARATTNWLKTHGHAADLVVANGANTWAPVDVNIVHFVNSAWRESPVHDARFRSDLKRAFQWIYSGVNAHLERRALARARRIVAVLAKVREELVAHGMPADRIQVIHNGVDTSEFHPRSASRTPLGLPEDVPLGLFAGDIRTPRKGLDTLIAALPDAPGVHLAVAGHLDGSPFPTMATETGVADRVHFLDFRRDMPDLMRAADFLTFPSRYEGASLVLLEAMGAGLPILTARSAGGAELITPDAGTVLEDSDDIEAVATELRWFARETRSSDAMSRAARAIAESNTWSDMAQKYLDLFEALRAPRALQVAA